MDQGGSAHPAQAYISASISDRNVRDHVATPAIDARRVRELVERAARDGDRDAFGDLYRLCHDGVYRFARFNLPGPSVEDAVAETFLRAWVAIPRYRDTGAPFSAWLVGIARHVVADAHRAARRTEPRADPPDRSVEFQDQATDRLALAAAVARLPKEQREVIELKYLLGWTNEEVGRTMGKSVGAVNALQWRALSRLKQLMELP
jgi:RNA polymerase sigma-70 factor, ECF subfamily